MRVLHTSDWHLGRTLHGHSRAAEHEAFLDELVELASDVDLVLISGDVFESSNPPIEAESLFFDTLARLGDGGRRAVVVIAGNHDSPDRLKAPAPLTASHAVWVLGRPGDVALPRRPGSRGVQLVGSGPSVLTLDLPTCGQRAVVVAVPYPSEARLKQLLTPALDERDVQAAYNRRIGQLFADLSANFQPDAVNLATSHLSVRSCMPSSSERTLIGGAWQIDGAMLPRAQYVALGHLHFAQAVADAPTTARYAGAPLAMRFSERDFPRAHVIVDVEPGGEPRVELVPIRAGRPLVLWEAESIEAVERGIADGLHTNAFIDLRIQSDSRLTHAEVARVKRLPRDIVRIRAVLPEAVVTPLIDPTRRREWPLSELFSAFYRDQTGHEPTSELTDLLVELAAGADRPAAARAAG